LVLIGGYAFWLFPFTIFEGFATLSNDGPSYMLLARKWSPFVAPGVAEATWPIHSYPPGFPWLLAVTGASVSTHASHLVVSLCLLASITILGWSLLLNQGWVYGGLLLACFVTLPGAVVSSMGILSENFFLLMSVSVLALYARIENTDDPSAWSWALLYFIVSVMFMTRTAGVAMIGALAVIAALGRQTEGSRRALLLLVAGGALATQLLWSFFDPQSPSAGYLKTMSLILNEGSTSSIQRTVLFLDSVRTNAVTLVASWNHYFTLSYEANWFFWVSLALLLTAMSATGVRALRLRLDAWYLLLYLAVLLVWPFPDEMLRFLHPAVMLLLAQPVLFAFESTGWDYGPVVKKIALAGLLVLLGHSLMVQAHLDELKSTARTDTPAIVNSLEYYNLANRRNAERQSLIFKDTMALMADTAQMVPPDTVVASAQHAAYSILADRPSVMLSTIIPFEQQLCNLKLRKVEFVFLSSVINTYNLLGLDVLEHYQPFTSQVWTIRGAQGNPRAHLLKLDGDKVTAKLEESNFNCVTARDALSR
jgi:hypothetical protein